MKLIIKHFILVLKRFRTSSLLNILGLAVAYAVFFMIVIQTYYDFSFDRNFEKADSIFLYSRIIPGGFGRIYTNTTEPEECAKRYPEIKNFCYLKQRDQVFDVKDSLGGVQNFSVVTTFASAGFVDVFTPRVIAGDARQSFAFGKSMLTVSVAKKFFGNENPVGKTFFYHNSDSPITVTAVCADFTDNCSMKNGVYLFQGEDFRSQWNYTTYFEINPRDKERLLKTLNKDQYMQKFTNRTQDEIWQYELTALPDIHLHFPEKGEGNLTTIISLLATGILLLIISYINFLNFSIAMAPVRVKSFNIRRILGESPWALKLSVVLEAVFLSCIAFLLSILFVNFLNTGAVKDFFRADLSISANWRILLAVGGFSLVTGVFAGIYPAFYTTSFKPAMALTGSFSVMSHTRWLKNILIGIQFITAIFLVIVTLFIKMQHDYLRNKDWGIRTENVLYLNTNAIVNDFENFETELKRNPEIVDVTFSQNFPGQDAIQQWVNDDFEGKEIIITAWVVRPDFLDFFGVNNIIAGNGFDANDEDKMILNQIFSKEYGISDVFGKEINGNEIIGIVEDFNFKSLREPVKPMAFVPKKRNWGYYGWAFIKIAGSDAPKAIDYIHNTWKNFTKEPLDVQFLDETLDNLYKKENNLAKLVAICGTIAIIVAIMGLYGLILFNAKAKRKTIALHKVHGASKTEVIFMLNHSLLVQFVVAYVIAVPLAYYVVNRWLEGFAYKMPMYWWVFILGGIIVLVISLITVSWQSYRAASVNPVEALKGE
jgi:putative ABC transport system permease protein